MLQILAEDQKMLEKLAPIIRGKKYELAMPKLSPTERDQRRLAYRNERKLHKMKSAFSGEEMISFFATDTPFKVYSHDEWWSDKWEASSYNRDYDFSRGFFEQFYELQLVVPRPPLVNNKAENSDYCNFADANKNCYLITAANNNEDSFYSWIMANNKDVVDCMNIIGCELCYECIDCHGCYNLRFSQYCENSKDSAFLLDCSGVSNCLFCANLRGKKYHIFNKPASKEEYEKFLNHLNGSHKAYKVALTKFEEFKKANPIKRAAHIVGSENCVGNNIFNSKNVYFGFDTYDSQDMRYVEYGIDSKDCMDISFYDKAQLCYECTSVMGYGYLFTTYCRDCVNILYCDNVHVCKDCFGCVGLRNKQFCIFNKQYSKEEYEKLVPRIIAQMKEHGEWGEFFPIKYSLFPYNETVAQDLYPLTKEEVLAKGWKWQDEKDTLGCPTTGYEIAENIVQVDENICEKILKCETSGKSFKVIKPELMFYRKMKLPVPRKSPEQRFKERLTLRTPTNLWERKCSKCGSAVVSACELQEVYCEKCYLEIIY